MVGEGKGIDVYRENKHCYFQGVDLTPKVE